ncbi:hypothetical protein N7520_002418 [Penicillium odoratum]|uniref:uncharacterized protein n=1 Tax=Penicillium odoratum TaxID=1167516 RepID=UPI0025488C63|nr:uncharacterized protein N7520_002418 [Penicillium odoratum]KAJ5771889.1 hypothetical protein N7520_002418 [Penicillium odoratum]
MDPADWLELLFAQDSRGAGIELEFRNVCLRRPRSTGCILSGANGKAQASSLTGIMGPSGSGKRYHFPALIGFVPQDDIVHPHLTVFENILHSARVRLRGTLNDAAIKERVDIVVDGLGLRKIKHSVVGSELRRVISGGERKRVSIALELVAAPQVLVLDEPTSGLDAQAALSLMELLRLFSRKGLTVISVVHQPRVEIFEALDNLLILESGECVYSGKALKAQQYFEAQGYTFHPNLNSADLIIDIVSGKFHPPNGDLVKSEEQALPFLDLDVDSVPSGQDGSNTDASLFRAIEAEYSKRITPWYKQLDLCLVRDLTQQHRQIAVFTLEILGSALTGFMIGLVVFDFHGHLFQRIYLSPFQSLSSSVNYHLVPETGILCSLAIGISLTTFLHYFCSSNDFTAFSAAYPSVATFGEESLYTLTNPQTSYTENYQFSSSNASPTQAIQGSPISPEKPLRVFLESSLLPYISPPFTP